VRQGARSARAREIEHRVAQLGDENGSSAQENGSSARRGTGSNASGAWSLPPRASPAAALAASSPSLAASTPSLAASSASLKDRSALRGTSSALRLTRPPLLAAPLPRGSTQRSAALVPPNLRGSASPEASPPAPAMPVRTLSTRGAPAHPRASPSLAPQPLASATSLRLRGFRAPAPPYPPRTASAGAAVLAGPADRPNGGAPPRLGAERGGSGSKGGGGPETRDTSRAPPAPDPHLGRAAFRARSAERRAAATGAAAAAVGGIGHAPAGSAGGAVRGRHAVQRALSAERAEFVERARARLGASREPSDSDSPAEGKPAGIAHRGRTLTWEGAAPGPKGFQSDGSESE